MTGSGSGMTGLVGSENSRFLVSEANVSIFLITLHAPLSTVLNRTLS